MRIQQCNAFLSRAAKAEIAPPLPLALVLLNSTDNLVNDALFQRLWSQAAFRVCADGGANRLFDRFALPEQRAKFVPDFIKGDLDSVRNDVVTYYTTLGTTVQKDLDQDCNDLDKVLQLLSEQQQKTLDKLSVVILGGMGGRFDQEMQNINALFRWKCFRRILVISNETLLCLLEPGSHEITPNFDIETRTCGLIPLGGPVDKVSTEGLKWNLSSDKTYFGGLVSSSNHIIAEKVVVHTSHPLIWTTGLKNSTLE